MNAGFSGDLGHLLDDLRQKFVKATRRHLSCFSLGTFSLKGGELIQESPTSRQPRLVWLPGPVKQVTDQK